MQRRLRIPVALVVAITGAGVAGCGDDGPTECRLFCVPSDPPPPSDAGPVSDAGPAPAECPMCSDEQGQCPVECQAVG